MMSAADALTLNRALAAIAKVLRVTEEEEEVVEIVFMMRCQYKVSRTQVTQLAL